ncbi:MAG TPA: hypothetical protein DEQ06_03930, partial [Porphyromonadaceae bacterium]|nr:hypothetical protein [Porphyromonadaceae bacterium]
LEMMGEEEYIRSIREKVSDNVASARSRVEVGEMPPAAPTYSTTGGEVAEKKVSMDEMPPLP